MIGIMYCKHCGKEIADDSRFCQHCGRNLDAFYDCLTEQTEEWNLIFCGTPDADAVPPAYMDALRRLCRAAQAENDRLHIFFEE